MKGRPSRAQFQFLGEVFRLVPLVGETVELFTDGCQLLGGKPPDGPSKPYRSLPSQIRHQADCQSRRALHEGMFRSRWDEEDRARCHGMLETSHPLDTLSAKVEKELAVCVPVRTLGVEGLEMAVHPEVPDRPVPATQAELPQEDRPDGSSH